MPLSRLSEFHPADIKKSDKASENASTSHSKNLIPGNSKGQHATPRLPPRYVSQPLSIHMLSELGGKRNKILIVNSGFCHYRNSLDCRTCPPV